MNTYYRNKYTGEIVKNNKPDGREWIQIFQKTEKQRQACEVLRSARHSMLVGGGRSTKTSIIVRQIFARAMSRPSRHLIMRQCFNHVKQSIWHDTFPKIIGGFFPGVPYKENKSDWYIEVPCINDYAGETSQIWFGGSDSKERSEKILGNEYSTIFCNEVSQITYETITMLRTRLAENSGLPLRFFYDLNPVGKKHWTYQEFIKGINPEDGSPSKLNVAHMFMNPIDNPHLPPDVLAEYEALPKRKRQRFLEGLYLDDIEGALWTDFMISQALAKEPGELIKKIIAVDPAVVHREGNDETGIIACGLNQSRQGVVIKDYTPKGSVSVGTWAQRVVNAYREQDANYVVAEINQGGDLVEHVLKNIDRTIKVVKVRASSGKFARAEPVSELYEMGQVAHLIEMPELESELTEWVPMNSNESPNRLDALVWGLTHLCIKRPPQIHMGTI
jgi:PBSX family phage terminase large subunit